MPKTFWEYLTLVIKKPPCSSLGPKIACCILLPEEIKKNTHTHIRTQV